MLKLDDLEKLLYWLASFIINLIIFTFMSVILLVSARQDVSFRPINLILQEEIPQSNKEISQSRTLDDRVSKVRKGSNLTPVSTESTHGDYQVPVVKEEPSILSQLEESVKKRKNQQENAQIPKEIGDLTATRTDSGISISTTGTRKVIYTPEIPKIVSDEPLSSVRVRIWVEPSGNVSKVETIQRSGSNAVDRQIVNFVKGIKFEPINGDVQVGILTFKLRGG